MKTFRTALAIALLSLTSVGCGDDEGDPVETIDVETTVDAGTPDRQPTEDPSNPAPTSSSAQCRSLPKLGLVCRGNVQCRTLPNVGLVCQSEAK
jgi:hypothetical protein